MHAFIELFRAIDSSTATLRKIDAIVSYFRAAPREDAVWALYLLSGRRQKRLLARKVLEAAIQQKIGIAPWLFAESYAVVGDLAETISLLLPEGADPHPSPALHVWMEELLPALRTHPEPQRLLQEWWHGRSREHNFILTKLITGGFRAGVAKLTLAKSLAAAFDRPLSFIMEKLVGEWPVDAGWLAQLAADDGSCSGAEEAARRPYPFYLASPLTPSTTLPPIESFAIEWKWDGIRAQLVKRAEGLSLWSRGEELLNEKFPDVLAAAQGIGDDCVLDGELLIEKDGAILPFAILQKRIGRSKLSAKFLAEHPALYIAFDCLEHKGEDLRPQPQSVRRERMEMILEDAPRLFRASPLLKAASWEEAERLRSEAGSRLAEGLMLKSWDGPYKIGRRRGAWWKWKIEPMTLDAVLIYAQAGHGRRANLFTDYTFALWKDDELVPFAKAYSGLSDSEILDLDRWIRSHTLERFGPVRSVRAERVFEIAFEGIAHSKRHKAGIAVRFPRILRERSDKGLRDADTVARAMELIHGRD